MESLCISCRRPNPALHCEACLEPLCKNCEHFLDSETFSFLKELPKELAHTHYCPACFDANVAPALEDYNEVMERAKKVYFFFKTHKRPPAVLKRAKQAVRVESCPDRNETILRLAFLAASDGFNAIVDADVVSEKIRNGAYQTSRWKGVGVPAEVDPERLERYQ